MKIDVKKCKSGYYEDHDAKPNRVEYLCRTIKYGDWCSGTRKIVDFNDNKNKMNNTDQCDEQPVLNLNEFINNTDDVSVKKSIKHNHKHTRKKTQKIDI